ncbi:MAG TPA: hypothetical protein VMI31_09185, partial [Fimbriimonadaceae bacterium]|nr:hypothetical protein [Fimbriimonadaceae bacterium]
QNVDSVDVHLMISSFCFFRVSNSHTFGVLFGRDLSDPTLRAQHKRMLSEAVLNLLGVHDAAASSAPSRACARIRS